MAQAGQQHTTDTGPFALVPVWVLAGDLSDRAVRLYAVLAKYADDDGASWPSRRTLATQWLHCSPDSVDRARAELEAAGALAVEARFEDGRQTSNRYTIHRVPPSARVPRGGRTEAEPGGRTEAHPGGRTGAAPELDLEEPNQNEHGAADGDATVAPPSKPRRRTTTATKPRERNPWFDALVEVFGPAGTRQEGAFYARVANELRDQGKDPADVIDRGRRARSRHATCTPNVLLTRWSNLAPPNQRGRGGTYDDLANPTGDEPR